MQSKQPKETWTRIGSVARILAGKLVVARELEKRAAASPDLGSVEIDGSQGGPRETPKDAGIGGKFALPPGEMVGRASAIDREERRALIGGIVDPHTELKSGIHIAPIPARTGRADGKFPAPQGTARFPLGK